MDNIYINGFPQNETHRAFEFETFNFGGGEVQVKLTESKGMRVLNKKYHYDVSRPDTFTERLPVTIYARANSSDDIMRILLVNDALRNMDYINIHLFLSYLPYARQDKVMVPGEALSVKVFANLINSCNFGTVGVFDPHSEVGPALLNNCRIISNHNFIKNVYDKLQVDHFTSCTADPEYTDKSLPGFKKPLLVSPDAGAFKKIFKLSTEIDYSEEIIVCNKARELSNGKIVAFSVSHSDLKGQDVLIVDDICAKGGTFMGLAARLKEINAGKIYLAVSHYEGNANISAMQEAGITKIFTTPSIGKVESDKAYYGDYVQVIPFANIM